MKHPVERRLAAILASDVVGYSRLMGADEEGTLETLKAHRRELVDPKIRENHGRIVKTTGDGMLVEFPSVVDAVRCAVEIQRAMVDRNAETAEDQRITFRIGVNLGDIIVDGGDIYGDGVNVAARLKALAEPGGICISRVVRDQTRDKLSYPFEDLGEHSVKNIARPVRVYAMGANAVASTPLVTAQAQPRSLRRSIIPQRAVIATGVLAVIGIAIVAWWAWSRGNSPTVAVQAPAVANPQAPSTVASTPAPRLSFVVLPFANLSSDPEQEYFADGITGDLTTDLSRISGSFVIARNTAFTYKGKSVDAKQVGRELGVRYVIEGSVRQTNDQVQVNVQLIDAESGAHLWADRFETDHANLAKAQNEITGRLARTLNLELTEAVSRRVERDGLVNPDAHDFLMRGWASYYRPVSPTIRQEALRAFERALEVDPQSVEARIGIGTVLVDDMVLRFSSSRKQDAARADHVLGEALERETNHSMAYFAMGVLRRVQNRLADSQIELETAIALDRNNARAFQQLGLTLMWLGQPEAAIPQIERAIRLNPHDPNIASYYWALGSSNLIAGRVDDALNLLNKARAANSRLFFIHLWLAAPLALRGDLAEARTALAESMKLKPDVNSLLQWRAESPWYTNIQFMALAEKTLYAGLRQAGFPDE
ncbi:MAG TPA: adenylate/guanylate cyclase domain-containing protein [Stellaceae bacterium]|nr:adenylate/guanylate cyclase domain-containing protein [Stellaceae bacterium]